MTERKSPIARLVALGALLAAVALVLVLLFTSGGGGHTYRLLFETGGQLVEGNEVRIGGVPVGTVEKIDLTEDSQAEVTINVDQKLYEGTSAVVRLTSLSGVANRYVSLSPGPNSGEGATELDESDVITQAETTSPVDIDQLFDTFRPRARRALQDVIRGQAGIYVGRGKAANRSYKFLNSGLSSTERLFAELTSDQKVFTDFIAETGSLVNRVASRRDDLSGLVSNTNEALGAIASQNSALERTLVALPPALRQSNTTFVDLRATLDDLDPFVAAAKPSTEDLAPFLRDLRPVAARSIPVFDDLGRAVFAPGPANDLADQLRDAPEFERTTREAVGPSIDALRGSQSDIEFAVPYSPDLMAFVAKLGEVTSYYDGNGHYAKVTIPTSLFNYDAVTGSLDPQPASQRYDQFDFVPNLTRCPGGGTQPAADGSSPYLGDGVLAGQCDPGDVPPG
jgi:phospholipid/cholesterol/gamma-HCH transport system substrate-binding protein